jgi:8-oxo-dGTP pyrophosphatase MutT (NUDIX family)
MSDHRRSGDGFMQCSDGRVRWGIFGAAGVVFAVATDDEPLVLLQLRSQWSHEGGTWSCPGGALDLGETPMEGALREAGEEIGLPVGPIHPVGEFVFEPATDWSYTTVVVEVGQPFGEPLNFETEAIEWVPVSDVDGRPLHSGFAGAWPNLRPIVESITTSRLDER